MRVHVAEVVGQEQMVLEFAGRAHGDQKKAAQFRVAAPATAFCDVGRYRGGATAKLGHEPINFLPRKPGRDLIDV